MLKQSSFFVLAMGMVWCLSACGPALEETKVPLPEGDFLGDCTDQIDNDLDGISDCEDPGCAMQADCIENGGQEDSNLPTTDGTNNSDTNTGDGNNNNDNNNDNNDNNNSNDNSGTDNNTGGGTSGPCNYPQAGSALQMGTVSPAYSWSGAYEANGNTVDFGFEDFYCNTEKLALIVVVVAEWCPNCPGYVEYVNQSATTLVSMGAEILYVSAQDFNYNLSTHSQANTYINGYINNGPGLRIGDGGTMPTAGGIYSSPAINGIPTAFVIQRSDMKVIADQAQDQYMLQFASILEGIGGTATTSPPTPTPPSTDANCNESDEESYEPNDDDAHAGQLSASVTFSGGVCGSDYDYYQVDVTGPWKIDLTFTHSLGDLDILIWDEAEAAFVREGDYYAGGTSADDNETYEGTGASIIAVMGYDGATAPYTLTFTDL